MPFSTSSKQRKAENAVSVAPILQVVPPAEETAKAVDPLVTIKNKVKPRGLRLEVTARLFFELSFLFWLIKEVDRGFDLTEQSGQIQLGVASVPVLKVSEFGNLSVFEKIFQIVTCFA